jgi:hypothetical protein
MERSPEHAVLASTRSQMHDSFNTAMACLVDVWVVDLGQEADLVQGVGISGGPANPAPYNKSPSVLPWGTPPAGTVPT